MERSEGKTKIVIDTNILISALINPNSLIWLILDLKNIEFVIPEFFLQEISKYSELIKKKISQKEIKFSFDYLISELIKSILIIPEENYIDMLPSALEIMKDVDEKDSPFLALAMKLNCPILSNDKHFKEQKSIKCYKIQEFIKEFKIKSA